MEFQNVEGIELIHCNEIIIAASCESNCVDEVEIYYPSTFLIYVEQGNLHIKHNQQLNTFGTGSFCLVKKYTKAKYFKTYSPEEGQTKTYSFALPNEFIRKIIHENYTQNKNIKPITERVITLEPNHLLLGVMRSIKTYVDGGHSLETDLLEMKTKEALMAIVKSNADLATVFKDYSLAERADLVEFMNYSYLFNIPLKILAKQSGRSLSTFNREFKSLFNTTPHRWIHHKRLEKARNLLLTTNESVSKVYLEVGFEDLAHFSKSFKKAFGINPSQIKRFIK
ncbi:MAG: helix-turn-helix domain-containing protein [Saprospiraceae bacterium]